MSPFYGYGPLGLGRHQEPGAVSCFAASKPPLGAGYYISLSGCVAPGDGNHELGTFSGTGGAYVEDAVEVRGEAKITRACSSSVYIRILARSLGKPFFLDNIFLFISLQRPGIPSNNTSSPSFAMLVNIGNRFTEAVMSTTTTQAVLFGSGQDVLRCARALQAVIEAATGSCRMELSGAEETIDSAISFCPAKEQAGLNPQTHNPGWQSLHTAFNDVEKSYNTIRDLNLGSPIDLPRVTARFQSPQGTILFMGDREERTSATPPDASDTTSPCSSEAASFSQLSTSETIPCGSPFHGCGTAAQGSVETGCRPQRMIENGRDEYGHDHGSEWNPVLVDDSDDDVDNTVAPGSRRNPVLISDDSGVYVDNTASLHQPTMKSKPVHQIQQGITHSRVTHHHETQSQCPRRPQQRRGACTTSDKSVAKNSAHHTTTRNNQPEPRISSHIPTGQHINQIMEGCQGSGGSQDGNQETSANSVLKCIACGLPTEHRPDSCEYPTTPTLFKLSMWLLILQRLRAL
ncbi:uncharacterized protein B0I36DRAFT_436188 [Microdochium trichocladiopsis]|uniref:Uncharacterized protein n=1 Tax=Microdochium trichocladiopsis TaxID=1682393 RepID=A0A9P9BJ94_9PEZI|nr:uncharacterized protein B0I36DRAFT_436188 [Microdochium trichocladiopsis]KAH7016556.1 hypothetical protein B0I36DRAFT_436188 [Microdochium trichocladiopsis]